MPDTYPEGPYTVRQAGSRGRMTAIFAGERWIADVVDLDESAEPLARLLAASSTMRHSLKAIADMDVPTDPKVMAERLALLIGLARGTLEAFEIA